MTNVNAPDKAVAPGCFGAASVYATDSDVCKGCPSYVGCGDASLEMLSKIRERVNVEDLLKKHRSIRSRTIHQRQMEPVNDDRPDSLKAQPVVKPVERKTTLAKVDFEIGENDMTMIAKLPAKAQPVAIRVIKSGAADAIRAGLAKGENTCPEKMATFLKEAINLMIAEGKFSKRRLKEHYIATNVLSPDSHVSQAISIIIGCQFGIITSEGEIATNPKLLAQNQ